MADDYLDIDRAKPHGNKLVSLAIQLIEVRAGIKAELEAANHMWNGGYVHLEEKFGLKEDTGANVLSLLTLANNILNTPGEVLGPDRLSQLNEFCSRLAGG